MHSTSKLSTVCQWLQVNCWQRVQYPLNCQNKMLQILVLNPRQQSLDNPSSFCWHWHHQHLPFQTMRQFNAKWFSKCLVLVTQAVFKGLSFLICYRVDCQISSIQHLNKSYYFTYFIFYDKENYFIMIAWEQANLFTFLDSCMQTIQSELEMAFCSFWFSAQ